MPRDLGRGAAGHTGQPARGAVHSWDRLGGRPRCLDSDMPRELVRVDRGLRRGGRRPVAVVAAGMALGRTVSSAHGPVRDSRGRGPVRRGHPHEGHSRGARLLDSSMAHGQLLGGDDGGRREDRGRRIGSIRRRLVVGRRARRHIAGGGAGRLPRGERAPGQDRPAGAGVARGRGDRGVARHHRFRGAGRAAPAERTSGASHRRLLVASCLAGACLLAAADGAARALGELPVGVVTSLAGGPVFCWILVRGGGGR